jgi:hypothetical protein
MLPGPAVRLQPRLLAAAAGALLAAVAFLLYLPSLDGYFLADDFGFIRLFHARPLSDFPALFRQDWSGGLWGHPLDEIRPVIALSYRLDSFLWGLDPLGYHLTNVTFHALSAVLVFLIARGATGGSAPLGLLAGLLFALSPTHVEAVSWIAARVDVISTTFYLASFYLFLRFREGGRWWLWGASFLAFVLALFSKEIAVTLPFLLLAYDLLCRRPPSLRALTVHLPPLALLGGYLFLRHLAFGSAMREQMLGLEALGAFLSRQGYYLGELLPPLRPLADAAASALALLVLAGLLALAWRRGGGRAGRLLFFGPVWHLLVLSPALVAYLPESHRYLLLPSAGLAVTIALAVEALPLPARPLAVGAALLLLLPLGLGLAHHQRDWVQAASLSRQFTRQAEATARQAPPGSAVVLDVPSSYGRAYLWAWALPFALEEPFSDAALYQRHTVLERPESYRCPLCWPQDRRQAMQEVLASQGDVYLVYLDGQGRAARRLVSGQEWRALAAPALADGAAAEAVLRLLDHLQQDGRR